MTKDSFLSKNEGVGPTVRVISECAIRPKFLLFGMERTRPANGLQMGSGYSPSSPAPGVRHGRFGRVSRDWLNGEFLAACPVCGRPSVPFSPPPPMPALFQRLGSFGESLIVQQGLQRGFLEQSSSTSLPILCFFIILYIPKNPSR